MAYFAYTGRDAQGALVKGTLEGADPGAAAGLLLAQGVTPLQIEETARTEAEQGRWDEHHVRGGRRHGHLHLPDADAAAFLHRGGAGRHAADLG